MKPSKPSLSKIPPEPGVYLYRDAKGNIIYIGKAKNLRNRVRSYWSASQELTPSKREMIREVSGVDFIVVGNEIEALLLEAGLIKKHSPRYNIVLRDDKDWTYIVITDQAFPRIITVHGRRKLKGEYFGPYTSAATARTAVRLMHQILPLRTCKRDLSKLPNGLVCMQYHLGRCLGPCEKKIGRSRYDELIDQARRILRGDTKEITRMLKAEMIASARAEHFEKAALLRNRIRALDMLSQRQAVVSPHQKNQDVVGIALGDTFSVVTVLQLRGGRMLDTLHYSFERKLDETDDEVLEQFLLQHYAQSLGRPKEILVPAVPSATVTRALAPLRLFAPVRGRGKRLRDLAVKNAWVFYHTKNKSAPLPPQLYALQRLFSLPRTPRRIEAYDISNIGGDYAVGAMIVAIDGELAPSQYRKFKIRTVVGSNDVRMMREMLERRSAHGSWGEPDLLLLDGGKPQLASVLPVLPRPWQGRVAALAKRNEELFVPGRSASIRLPANDPSLLLLRRLRDTVHRHAITYYRRTHRSTIKKHA